MGKLCVRIFFRILACFKFAETVPAATVPVHVQSSPALPANIQDTLRHIAKNSNETNCYIPVSLRMQNLCCPLLSAILAHEILKFFCSKSEHWGFKALILLSCQLSQSLKRCSADTENHQRKMHINSFCFSSAKRHTPPCHCRMGGWRWCSGRRIAVWRDGWTTSRIESELPKG